MSAFFLGAVKDGQYQSRNTLGDKLTRPPFLLTFLMNKLQLGA
jgi:hypothetical protein